MGNVLVSLLVTSADGSQSHQLGLKTIDGAVVAHFIWDGTSQRLVDSVAMPEATSANQVFPSDALDGLGEDVTVEAVLTLDGVDVDRCTLKQG